MITNKELIKALKYYNIHDQNYFYKYQESLELIKNDSHFFHLYQELYDILFVDQTQKIRELWNKKLSETCPFMTNILLLSGYKYHDTNMKKQKFNKAQIKIHKKRIKQILQDNEDIRMLQLLWGAYFIRGRIIEIENLQFEYFDAKTIYIHIPRNSKFNIERTLKSIKQSKKYIKKYFHTNDFDYYCNSWLLSKQIHELVNQNSNIYQFYNLFEIKEGEDCLHDILKFVYDKQEIEEYRNLPENTTLRKSIKEYLMKEKKIYLGIGKLKTINEMKEMKQ